LDSLGVPAYIVVAKAPNQMPCFAGGKSKDRKRIKGKGKRGKEQSV
jgi:hypothetical protein